MKVGVSARRREDEKKGEEGEKEPKRRKRRGRKCANERSTG